MKKQKNKLLYMIFACVLMFGILLTPYHAQASTEEDFSIFGEELSNYYGTSEEVIIPNGVTTIYMDAFHGNQTVKTIIIPDGVTKIGDRAFQGCTNLTTVVIPNSVTEIGSGAFADCENLNNVILPNSLTKIDDFTFTNCKSLTNITLPSNLTYIGEWAFKGCPNLTNVTIPDSVTYIDDEAFDNLKPSDLPSNKPTIDPNTIQSLEFLKFDSTVTEGSSFWIDAVAYFENIEDEIGSSDEDYSDLFVWKSSDEKIIRTGMGEDPDEFLAMKPGKATLTLTVGNITKSVQITVTDDKEIYYVVPDMRYKDKEKLVRTKGVHVNNEKELFQYVYDNLSQGNYKLAVYFSDKFDVIKSLDYALELYDEYVLEYDKPDRKTWAFYIDYKTLKIIKTDKNALHYPYWKQDFVRNEQGKQVAVVKTLYNPNAKTMVQKMNKKADSILKQIIKPNMSDKQKLKAIHDYIIKVCDYDREVDKKIKVDGKTYYNKKRFSVVSHTAYGALIKKKAVCDGYTHAFNLLARKAGIKTILISGVAGAGHTWNMVKLNNKFYFIDVTWDDPVNLSKFNKKKPFAPIISRTPRYKYFLISSNQLKKDHYFFKKNSESLRTFTESEYYKIFNKYKDYTVFH